MVELFPNKYPTPLTPLIRGNLGIKYPTPLTPLSGGNLGIKHPTPLTPLIRGEFGDMVDEYQLITGFTMTTPQLLFRVL